MLDVVIISNYWHFPPEKSSSRYHSLALAAAEKGWNVEVVTSTFYHTKKAQREEPNYPLPYNVKLIREPGYAKNVTPKRVLSHRRFAVGVSAYLKARKAPDVIYLFVPPTGLAKRVVKFAVKHNVRIVIDVLDLWPEAFGVFLPSVLARVLLLPMKRAVEYAYANADEIIAVSDTYVQRALRHSKKCHSGHRVFIGTELSVFDAAAADAPQLEGKLRPITLAYIGMLGHNYDLCGLMDALESLRAQGTDEVELLVMGDGPLKGKFERCAEEKQLPVRFTGRLPYEEMVKKLVKCDIAVSVIDKKSRISVINKHADYVAAGLPIINVQSTPEFGKLLLAYHAGYSCAPGNIESLAESIKELAANPGLRTEMGKNSRRLAEDLFDRSKTYGEILNAILGESQ